MTTKKTLALALAIAGVATTACTTGTTVANFVPNIPATTRNIEPPTNHVETKLVTVSSAQATILCTNPTPIYPPMSIKLGEEGTAVVKMALSSDGTLKGVQIAQSSGHMRLDRAAIAAAAKTRCDVFLNRQTGNPPDVWAKKPFAFRLTNGTPATTRQ